MDREQKKWNRYSKLKKKLMNSKKDILSEYVEVNHLKDMDFFGNSNPEHEAQVVADRKANTKKCVRVKNPVQKTDEIMFVSEVKEPIPFFDFKSGRYREVTGVVRVYFDKEAAFLEDEVNDCVRQGFVRFFPTATTPERGCTETNHAELTDMIMKELKAAGINAKYAFLRELNFAG